MFHDQSTFRAIKKWLKQSSKYSNKMGVKERLGLASDSKLIGNGYKVLGKLNDYFTPKRNVIHERAAFYQRNQKDGESVEEYMRSLYELSQCAKLANKEENLGDRLVLGLNDKEL